MRGKQRRVTEDLKGQRITPAHAGKTCYPVGSLSGGSDHPRACGENASARRMAFSLNGSPPRMRGKLGRNPDIQHLRRITPAHAGKTVLPVAPIRRITDHPRACGENSWPRIRCHNLNGSPPRMRGKLAQRRYSLI